MKIYRNNKGIVIYERSGGYSVALSIQGKIHYATLFHQRTNVRARGFWETYFPPGDISVSTRLFPNLIKSLEEDYEKSDKRKG